MLLPMSTIYLIRHGQASFGADNYDRLSPLGMRQSRILGQCLLDTGIDFDEIYSGPLSRHTATAKEFIDCYKAHREELPALEILNDFDEYDMRSIIRAMVRDDPSMKDELSRIYSSDSSFRKVFEKATIRWVSGRFDSHEIETWEALKERVSNSMTNMMNKHEKGHNIGIFTSGGAISAALSNVLGLSGEQAMRLNWQIVNTSITRFICDSKRISLAGFNSIAHLELLRDGSLITYR
jgi:broad specificity phosphatase PhoE